MTSEVLILNKRAIVLGADSAVTTSGGDHPRYSKTANKIFELSKNGSVAAAIYGSASVDGVPWELAIKLFRAQLDNAKFDSLAEYGGALFAFLNANAKFFPQSARALGIEKQFDDAVKMLFQEALRIEPQIFDSTNSVAERSVMWARVAGDIEGLLGGKEVAGPLTKKPLEALLADLGSWKQRVEAQISLVPEFTGVDALKLAEFAHRVRYRFPKLVLAETGVVIAGYGEEQIFPAYEQFEVLGHVGDELYFEKVNEFQVQHNGIAMIKPLAQTSMIDMFTDGFGSSLERVIDAQGKASLQQVFQELADAGVTVDDRLKEQISDKCHRQFMDKWKSENWKQNFHPLLAVLQSLSISEMAHLAESLLGLESLKERVTSPSESVGGPIDVAAITKTEGLVWIKRKHYFDPSLNLRYAARLERSLS